MALFFWFMLRSKIKRVSKKKRKLEITQAIKDWKVTQATQVTQIKDSIKDSSRWNKLFFVIVSFFINVRY